MDFDYSTETITPELTNLLTVGGTGGFELPIGTTAERPVSGLANGALRYNTDLNNIEGYVNNSWTTMATGTTSITLTGDVTGSGAGTIPTTLATVNSNVGTFASVTVNAKGLVTAATALSGDVTSSGATVTLATVNSNVGQFSAVTVNGKGLVTAATNLAATGDATGTASGAGIALTLATVNASPQTDTFRKITVNGKGLVTATSAVTTGDITTALGYTPVNKAGDSMSSGANLTFVGGGTVTGLPTPTNGTDAANKNYVDSSIAGLSWKQSVRVATTTNGTLASSFANGQTIDGITLATGDRILIKNQTTQTENGIYIVAASGAPSRSSDADTGAELVGATVYVDQGTTQADTGWTQTTAAPITIGSSNIVWAQFSGSGSYTAGTGLTLTGNQFSLTSPVVATLGGTGQTTYAIGDILYASTTSALSRLADVATGNALISGGVNTAPSWGKIGLTTHVTGTLPVANGGTNLTSLGTANQILGVNTGATGLEYKTVTAGTAISVTPAAGSITIANTGVTSIAGTANQITASAATGAVTLSLPANVTIGTSLTVSGLSANSFLYSGTAGLLTTATPTNGQLLIGSTGAAPVAATLTAGTGMSITNGAGSITLNNTGVTSVGLSLPGIFTVTGSPVTTTGTLTASLASQSANLVFASPNGSAGTPSFRSLAYADLPIVLFKENPSSPVALVASGNNSVAIGSGASSTGANAIAHGAGSSSNVANIVTFANGSFASAGDAQSIRVVLRNSTTNATTTELFIDGSAQRLVLPNNSAWTYNIQVVGRRTDATGGYAMYNFVGGIVRDATAATTTIPASSRTTIFETDGAWNCTISADTTNGSLKINVTGQAAKTIRWVATIELTQVTN